MKEGNELCEMHEEEIVLSLEYFVPDTNGLAIGLYCLSVVMRYAYLLASCRLL